MLTRLGMRIAAARALRDATLAQHRVFDSAVEDIDKTISENRKPILIVTTDEDTGDITGRDLFCGSDNCELVIEMALASKVTVGEGEAAIEVPHTDEGMEIMLDMMEHQVVAALLREKTIWSQAWKALVAKVNRRVSRRGASSSNGIRFAARQLMLGCELIASPSSVDQIGPGTAWAQFLTAMASDEELAPLGEVLRGMVENDPSLPWEQASDLLGIQHSAARSTGIAPYIEVDEDAVVIDELQVEATPEPDMTINVGNVSDQGQ